MIRLQTLGALDLRAADGSSLQPVMRQPKRLALLAYLAIEKPGQFLRRDELLGLFWPEADLRRGRASLSQAVLFLRQYLGKDAIINRGDEEIGVAADLVWCDAAAFQQQMAGNCFADAMALYTGPLLPAFFVDEASGFEQWLEQKRDTLQREAMRACGALADEAEEQGRHEDVVSLLRRAIGYFPYDESLHRRLIQALDRSGDRAAALLAYDALVRTLRTEFDAEPSAETNEVIQAVRARSEARVLPALLRPRRDDSPASQGAAARARGRIVWAVGLAVLIAGGVIWGAFARRESPAGPPVNRIAVLYFNDESPGQELEYLAEGLTSALIDHLGQVRQVEVISLNGVRPFRGDSIPLDSIARLFDVGTIVGGGVSRSGDQLRVTVEIVKGASGVVASSRKFVRPTGELFALLDDVAGEVGSFLRETLGEEVKLQRYQRETESVPAWQAVQKAEQLLEDSDSAADRGDMNGATALFNRADSMLVRAAQLDKRWETPFVVRSRGRMNRAFVSLIRSHAAAQEQLSLALAAAHQAIDRNDRSAAAFEALGRARFLQWLVGAPSGTESSVILREAETALTRALELDQERARAESTLSMLYESQGRFADARQAARRALDADAYLEDSDQIVVRLFQSSFELGDDDEAGRWCDEIRRRLTGKWPAAYCDLILLAWRKGGSADARKALYILETFGANDRQELRAAMRPRLAVLAAAAVARSGDTARAEQMVREAHAAAPGDLEVLHFEAALRVHLNELQTAAQLLARYLERNPNARPRIENGRMFKPLRESLVTRAAVGR